MGFTFQELGNLWEKLCPIDEVVQVPSKYFDDLGENMRTLLDGIAAEWCGTPASANGAPVDDLPLDGNPVADCCKMSEDGSNENILNETLPSSDELDPFICSGIAKDDLDHSSICAGHSMGSVSTKDPENEVLSETHQNKLIVELKSLETTSLNTTYETSTPQELVCHVKSRDEYEEQNKPCNLEVLVQPQLDAAFPEISYNSRRDNMFNSIDKVNLKTEPEGEFEDLNQDCWDDDEDYDFALASYHEWKKRQYKIKLGSSFLSKLIHRKPDEQVHDVCHGIHTGTQEIQEIAPSSASEVTPSHDSLEADWELL